MNAGAAATDWTLSAEPQADYLAWAEPRRALFFLPDWMQVLAALGAQPLYAWNARHGEGLAVPVFRRGPLRIAYVGFPTLPLLAEAQQLDWRGLRAALLQRRAADLVRASRSEIGANHRDATAMAQPELLVRGLAGWFAARNKRLERDVKHARKAAADFTLTQGGESGAELFALYRATVLRHGGSLRYTPEYFAALAALAVQRPDLLAIRGLRVPGGALRAFAVAAVHEGAGYYLHAGIDSGARISGAADLLLWELMTWARDAAVDAFSLMASPPGQGGLVKFKAKWANETSLWVTEDRASGWKGRLLAAFLHWRQSRRAAPDAAAESAS